MSADKKRMQNNLRVAFGSNQSGNRPKAVSTFEPCDECFVFFRLSLISFSETILVMPGALLFNRVCVLEAFQKGRPK